MVLRFHDLRTMLSHTIDTDITYYVTYNDNNNRVIAYTLNGFNGFTQRLSNLLLEFVYNKIDSFIYFIDSSSIHYLVNVNMVENYYITPAGDTHIDFINNRILVSKGKYPFQAIQKAMDTLNENRESQEVHTNSETNS